MDSAAALRAIFSTSRFMGGAQIARAKVTVPYLYSLTKKEWQGRFFLTIDFFVLVKFR
jgi:hypothetical protein